MHNLTMLQNMVLAAYLNRSPDVQVRKMAKKYRKLTKDKKMYKTLTVIIKSSNPSKVVIDGYNVLYD